MSNLVENYPMSAFVGKLSERFIGCRRRIGMNQTLAQRVLDEAEIKKCKGCWMRVKRTGIVVDDEDW